MTIERASMLPVNAVQPEPGSLLERTPHYLCAREVSIAYAGQGTNFVLAIDRVDLSVARGEFVCLLGPSGCGKTTFLNAVAGLLPISSGKLILKDRLID